MDYNSKKIREWMHKKRKKKVMRLSGCTVLEEIKKFCGAKEAYFVLNLESILFLSLYICVYKESNFNFKKYPNCFGSVIFFYIIALGQHVT